MKYFNFFSPYDVEELFYKKPVDLTLDSTSKKVLATALGATLYIPSTRKNLLRDLYKMRDEGAMSVVFCLEDAISDDEVSLGEQNIKHLLQTLKSKYIPRSALPFIFIRVRSPEHLEAYSQDIKPYLHLVAGFVFPKFDSTNNRAQNFLRILNNINQQFDDHTLYGMPVLETEKVIFENERSNELSLLHTLLATYEDQILAIRIGATDFSSCYGLRRNPDFTIYDVRVIASTIASIVNQFARVEESMNYIVTGAVWEHFTPQRLLKPQLRESLFSDEEEKALRKELVQHGYDTFIKEIQLDNANGITGKTVIHPSHIMLVNSLLCVTYEEYQDALMILGEQTNMGGAYASPSHNKMNEVKPHHNWAVKTMARAQAFGVLSEGTQFLDLVERKIARHE